MSTMLRYFILNFWVLSALLCSGFLSNSAFADFTVRGHIVIKDSIYYLKTDNPSSEHLIIAADEQVQKHLQCLEEDDYLSGAASVINGSHFVLKSVEYVGINKLLASWRDDSEVFNFYDFRTFYYWQFNKGINRFRGPFPYHYVLSPNGGSTNLCSWKIFITNETEVVFGVINFVGSSRVRLDIYDSNTGEIYMTKILFKTNF